MLHFIVLSTTVICLLLPVISDASCHCNENKQGCGSTYCDNKRFACPAIGPCNGTQVQKAWPEQCICCLTCFKVVSEGEPCGGDPIYAVCANGLKCCSNVCRKVD
ncbi:keratin-associated protein 5-6 isoform X5 [Diabrotica virgifera virgifera]|uniref:Uncharacterized protein n=1 Tax=Diabrotica virgifera virgifera TaxID=50390 RepID=A0ABM5ILJ9_DIAVI|nr:keratin-associated protein 5-6 isoform X5 [Diabrotica virgifera virgifera]